MWLPRGRKGEATEELLGCLGHARAGSRRAVVVLVLVLVLSAWSTAPRMAVTSDAHRIASRGSMCYTIGYHMSSRE